MNTGSTWPRLPADKFVAAVPHKTASRNNPKELASYFCTDDITAHWAIWNATCHLREGPLSRPMYGIVLNVVTKVKKPECVRLVRSVQDLGGAAAADAFFASKQIAWHMKKRMQPVRSAGTHCGNLFGRACPYYELCHNCHGVNRLLAEVGRAVS